jgi:hypothetical protein
MNALDDTAGTLTGDRTYFHLKVASAGGAKE